MLGAKIPGTRSNSLDVTVKTAPRSAPIADRTTSATTRATTELTTMRPAAEATRRAAPDDPAAPLGAEECAFTACRPRRKARRKHWADWDPDEGVSARLPDSVVAVTLLPGGYTPALTLRGFLCVGCGATDTSDILRNWLLFLPVGALLALVVPDGKAVMCGLGLSALLETLQIGVPGRDPALQDLLSNGLGAWCGVLIQRRGLGRGAQTIVALMMAAVWLSPVVLVMPLTTGPDLYGLWTPALGSLERYDGRILDVTIGDVPVPSRRVADGARLEAALRAREPIAIELRVGHPPAGLAPVLRVADGSGVEIVTVAARGDDLLVRARSVSHFMRMDQPDIRWAGAMRNALTGDTVGVIVDRRIASTCISVAERRACGTAPSLADGWGFILNVESAPLWLRTIFGLTWSVGVGTLLGLCSGSRGSAGLSGATLATTGLVASALSPDLRPDVGAAASLAAGALVGWALRSRIDRVVALFRPSP
jgi:hypothetical protein